MGIRITEISTPIGGVAWEYTDKKEMPAIPPLAAGRKIINDALVKTETIKDDSPKYLGYGTNTFVYTDVPFIRVEIEEVVTPASFS